MKWNILFYKGVAEEILTDWPKGIKAKFSWTIEQLKIHGPQELGMPYVKSLGKGLFEIRLQGHEGIGRALYCLLSNKEIYILNAFIKKTQKTPEKELDLARKRMKELI
jgi:phage-related protein